MSLPVFITGTDTGVGKTLLTALLLEHLRRAGTRVRAAKPFATGVPSDARLLDRLQAGALPRALLSPFHFQAPLAPLVAARLEGREVTRRAAVAALRAALAGNEVLLIEGCGGLRTPLGPGYSAGELIAALDGLVIVCARNRLGVLNQVRLALDSLGAAGSRASAVVLMGGRRPDASAPSNPRVLRELVTPVPVFVLPYLGPGAASKRGVVEGERGQRRLLARLRAVLVRESARRDFIRVPVLPKKGSHSTIPGK